MAITLNKPTLTALRPVGSCDKGILISLELTVTGTAAKGDLFDVNVFDEDFGSDVLIYKLPGVAVGQIRKQKKFVKVVRIPLFCNCNCYVSGNEKTSGESITDVYAVVSDPTGIAGDEMSNTVEVECVSSTTVLIDPHGSHFDEHAWFSVEADEGAVERKVSLRIDFNPDPPRTAYFPDEIDTDARLIAIGEPFFEFTAPVIARWQLSADKLRRLTDFEGAVISYDPCSQDWTPVADFSVDGDAVAFPIKSSGLYGRASNAQYMKSC